MIVRAATPQDWPRIWPFFAQIVAAGETYAYPDPIDEDAGRALWMLSPPAHTVVAVDDLADPATAVLGSATWGPNRPGRGSHIATASFMVNPSAQGKGVGRALAEHVVDAAAHAGYHGMQFNAVVETNASAVHLWQALGFRIIGTVPEAFRHPEHGLVGLHVMYRPLGPAR
jgi:GNAT superfamily N-acetyltransferase